MRGYGKGAGSSVRVEFGVELVAGLNGFAETRGLAPAFAAKNDALDAAVAGRHLLRKPLAEARAAMRFTDFQADQQIRVFSRAIEIADGGRRGPLFEAIFPRGLSPVVAPRGGRQIVPTRALIEALERCTLAGAEALRTEWKPRLEAALAALVEADARVSAADANLQDAFRRERALREDHARAVDVLIGAVRSAFPRDPARQNVVFPCVEARRSRETTEAPGSGNARTADRPSPPADAVPRSAPRPLLDNLLSGGTLKPSLTVPARTGSSAARARGTRCMPLLDRDRVSGGNGASEH